MFCRYRNALTVLASLLDLTLLGVHRHQAGGEQGDHFARNHVDLWGKWTTARNSPQLVAAFSSHDRRGIPNGIPHPERASNNESSLCANVGEPAVAVT